jgi:multiple sugar transport system ATP-binding protein
LTMRGAVDAVRDISLEVEDSEFFAILGPSGCGKSTLLNLAAGLERPTAGEICFDDRVVASSESRIFLPPRDRNVAMVFQSYALYPHLNVYDNIAFPLRIAREKDTQIKKAVKRAAEMLGIENLLERKPAELSGGQRQRVSIARALVRRPEVFLLDEPLSNLDAQLRTGTRAELKRLQRELKITTLYVTHDQTEAMTLGDRIALLKDGSLVQAGTPKEMYEQPRTAFAATFIGSPPMNLVPAQIKEKDSRITLAFSDATVILPGERAEQIKQLRKQQVLLGIRPEHVTLRSEASNQTLLGTVTAIEPLGREALLHISTECCNILVLTTQKDLKIDERVHVCFDPNRVHLFGPKQPERD